MNPLPAEFFLRFGLFAERGFLPPEDCATLREEMREATGTPATVADEQGGSDAVDETYRRTKQTEVSQATSARLSEELLALMPRLESHFERPLAGVQRPQFLLYREGDFFRPHPDDSPDPDAPDFVRQRSVSAVVFLNGTSPEDGAGYTGGLLTFFGLMNEGTSGESVGLPLAGETGLFVAFPSRLVHSVSPVLTGERYTVVSWFYEDSSSRAG